MRSAVRMLMPVRLPPIGLRNIPTPRGPPPTRPPMDPIAQIFDPAIEIGFVVLPRHPVDARSRGPLQREERGTEQLRTSFALRLAMYVPRSSCWLTIRDHLRLIAFPVGAIDATK